jgi:hypothetical protein
MQELDCLCRYLGIVYIQKFLLKHRVELKYMCGVSDYLPAVDQNELVYLD